MVTSTKTRLAMAKTTSAVATVPKTQSVTETQSVQLVQTLLHGSFSCIAYLREFFPDKCFEYRVYRPEDSQWSYDDYLRGHTQGKTPIPVQRGGGMPVCNKFILRDKHHAADRFLNWLEHGAFNALKAGVLRALQLRIFENPIQPENVLETYTFTFKYAKDSAGHSQVAMLEFKGPNGKPVTVRDAQEGLKATLRSINNRCDKLPLLPYERYMSMVLHYIDDSETFTEPSDFEPCLEQPIFFPDNNEWKMKTFSCRVYDGGQYHRMHMTVSHLDKQATAGDEIATQPEGDLEETRDVVPSRLQCIRRCEAGQDVVMEDETGDSSDATLPSTPQASRTTSHTMDPRDDVRPQIDIDLDETSGLSGHAQQVHRTPTKPPTNAPWMTVPETPDLYLSPATNHAQVKRGPAIVGDTQMTDDVEVQARLEDMLQAPIFPDSLVDTQDNSNNVLGQLAQASALSMLAPHDAEMQNGSLGRVDFSSENSPLAFSQQTTNIIEKRKRRHPEFTTQNAESVQIACECGIESSEDNMLECDCCHKRQHLGCYGFLNAQPISSPYACYTCLLEDTDKELLRSMKELAFLRRAVSIIRQKGYSGDRALGQALGTTIQQAKGVSEVLKDRGILVTVTTSAANTKKTRQASSTIKFAIVTSGAECKKMMEEYFNPKSKIEHLFQLKDLPMTDKFILDSQPPDFLEDQDTPTAVLHTTAFSHRLRGSLDSKPTKTKSISQGRPRNNAKPPLSLSQPDILTRKSGNTFSFPQRSTRSKQDVQDGTLDLEGLNIDAGLVRGVQTEGEEYAVSTPRRSTRRKRSEESEANDVDHLGDDAGRTDVGIPRRTSKRARLSKSKEYAAASCRS